MGARADNPDCEDGKSLSAPRTVLVILNRLHLTLRLMSSLMVIYTVCAKWLLIACLHPTSLKEIKPLTLVFELAAWNY